MNKANIVNITQSSFSLSHITPPIMNHRSCDELGTYILAQNTLDPQGKASNKRTSIM